MKDDYVGYLKYTGKSVENGLMDVKKSAEALLGLDEILRYFLLKEDPSLKDYSFEIPVEIRKGSWATIIPEIIDTLISLKGISGSLGLIYFGTTAKQAAQEGFSETGFAKDIKKTFRCAIKSAQWVIKIASHVGSITKKKFDNLLIEQKNNGAIVKIPNDKGEYLEVPKKYFDLFLACPKELFSRNVCLVEEDRVLEIGVKEEGKTETVSITKSEKTVFCEESEDDILFPELVHDQYVELSGEITRINENTNTIGFKYNGHILTCEPKEGSIANFKGKMLSQEDGHVLAQKVKVSGFINRFNKDGQFKDKKPQILFIDIVSLEYQDKQTFLFDK